MCVNRFWVRSTPTNRNPIEINEASIREPSISVAAVDPIDTIPRISQRDGFP